MLEFVSMMIPDKIIVIGCGGTGSRLVPQLCQFIATNTHSPANPRGRLINPKVILVDDDVVEEKNLLRQNFIASDVGKPKAAVLANRYGRAYGVNVTPVVRKWHDRIRGLSGADGEPNVYESLGNGTVVILAVDKVQARKDILKSFGTDVCPYPTYAPSQAPFFIDAGNEGDFGQVSFFHRVVTGFEDSDVSRRTGAEVFPQLTPVKRTVNYIPMDVGFYERLQDHPGASCAALDQTLAVNSIMASLIMGVFQSIVFWQPMRHTCVRFSLQGSASTDMLTPMTFVTRSASNYDRDCWSGIVMDSGAGRFLQEYATSNYNALAALGMTTGVDNPLPALEAPEGTPIDEDGYDDEDDD